MDAFESRLAGIEDLLRRLADKWDKHVPTPTPAPYSNDIPAHCTEPGFLNTPRDGSSECIFEGDTSLSAHANFASGFLRNTLQNLAVFHESAPQMTAALSTLEEVVASQKQWLTRCGEQFPNQEAGSPREIRSLPLPPIPTILHILKEAKAGMCCDRFIFRFSASCTS